MENGFDVEKYFQKNIVIQDKSYLIVNPNDDTRYVTYKVMWVPHKMDIDHIRKYFDTSSIKKLNVLDMRCVEKKNFLILAQVMSLSR
jgi:hypothetical protein